MDKHKHYQEEIVAYLMGELPAVGRQALCDHLRSCDSCKKLLEDYRVTLDLAGAIPDPEPPPGFTDRVLASVRAARASHEQFLHEQALQEAHAADTSTFERTTPSWRRSLAYRTARIVAYASIAIIVFIAAEKELDDRADRATHTQPPGTQHSSTARTETDAAVAPQGAVPDIEGTVWPEERGPEAAIEEPAPVPRHIYLTPPDMEVPVAVIHPPSVPVINLHIAKVQIPNSAYEARLDWRKKKNAMRRATVGSEACFAIVQGLWWLARHQDLDGKWSAAKFTMHCRNSRNCADHSAPSLSDEAITATALLAMLGDGHTPSQGKFRVHVARGIQWLQSRQQPDGAIGEATNRNKHFLLGHAIATAALAEAYGITGEARYRASAQKAVGYLLEHDITVIDEKLQVKTANIGLAAVRMAALGAAEIARLDLTRGSATAAARRLAGIRDIQASVYTSQAPSAMTTRPAITVGMLALLDPTSKPDDSLLNGEAPRMREHMPDWETNGQTYWLCGSIVAKRIGKNVWWRWNQALQKTLSKNQVKRGHAIGSWQANDPTTKLGGRVFATALSVLALETPYR